MVTAPGRMEPGNGPPARHLHLATKQVEAIRPMTPMEMVWRGPNHLHRFQVSMMHMNHKAGPPSLMLPLEVQRGRLRHWASLVFAIAMLT